MENKPGAYSSLREQGEQVPFQYAEGFQNAEGTTPEELMSYANARKSAPQRRKMPVAGKSASRTMAPTPSSTKPTLKRSTAIEDYRKKSDARKKQLASQKVPGKKIAPKGAATTLSPSTDSSTEGLSKNAKIGLAVGVGVLLLIVGYMYFKSKKK